VERLRRWFLGDVLNKLQAIESQVSDVDKRLRRVELQVLNLQAKLDDKADKERLRFIERELEQIENLTKYLFDTLRDLQRYAEAEMKGSEVERGENQISDEERLLALIKMGYDSPKNLAKKAKIGVGRLYEILERLEKENKVRTIKKGRRRKLILVED